MQALPIVSVRPRWCSRQGSSAASSSSVNVHLLRLPAPSHSGRWPQPAVWPRPRACALAPSAVPGATSSARVVGEGGVSTVHIHPGQQQAATQRTEAAVSGGALSAINGAPFASFTRVFLVGQPSNLMRTLAGRKWRAGGPISLLIFLAGLLLGLVAAVRTALIRRVKSCPCCRGYGIVRCRLCNGEGSVEWRGKNNHQENCPLCMTRRFVTCPDCGGHYHRKTFIHITPATRGPVPDFLGA